MIILCWSMYMGRSTCILWSRNDLCN